ncbi:MAG: hypothetical protein AB8B96_00825 [Lysobacterales bacterium]
MQHFVFYRWLIAIVFLSTLSLVSAQDLEPDGVIFRSDIDLLPGTDQGFGNDVSVDGEWAVVGASLHFGQDGQVYLFRRSEGSTAAWNFIKVLDRPAEPQNLFRFGQRVHLDGDWLAVTSSNSGTHLYHRNAGGDNNWGFSQRLVVDDISSRRDRDLDNDVVIAGNWLVIGAARTDYLNLGPDDGNDVGSVLIYELREQTWVIQQVLEFPESTIQPLARFGDRVAIEGDVLAVAAPEFSLAGFNEAGRVYVYQNRSTGWSLRRTLTPLSPKSVGRFGESVAVSGGVIAVGEILGGDTQTPDVSNDGSIHVFERDEGGPDNWGRVINLVPSEPEFINLFGQSVGLVGNLLLAGSQDGAYLFANNGSWEEVDRNPVPTFADPSNVREFGFSADLAVVNGGQQVIALLGDKTAENSDDVRVGAAFFYAYDDGLFADGFEQ